MTSSNSEVTIIKTERRRRWNAHEKRAIVEETYQPGMSVSYVARRHGIAPSMLFYWRRKMEDASIVGVGSEEPVVPQSKVRELEARIKQLERALGRASLDNEILREAVKIGREKNSSRGSPCPVSKIWIKSHLSSIGSIRVKSYEQNNQQKAKAASL